MRTIGLLYPGTSAINDFDHLTEALAAHDVSLLVQETSVGVDAHEVGALLDLGSAERLGEAAARIAHRVDAITWACTSGSFVFGWEGAHQQVAQITERTGLPASSTSLAFMRACRAMNLRRVVVAASYPQEVAEHFVSFLRAAGVEITGFSSHDIHTAAEVGTLGHEEVAQIVSGVQDVTARDGAQAILVPDTAMHTLAHLEHLELVAGLPVLTANQVTVFDALGVLGLDLHLDGFGSLFASPGVDGGRVSGSAGGER